MTYFIVWLTIVHAINWIIIFTFGNRHLTNPKETQITIYDIKHRKRFHLISIYPIFLWIPLIMLWKMFYLLKEIGFQKMRKKQNVINWWAIEDWTTITCFNWFTFVLFLIHKLICAWTAFAFFSCLTFALNVDSILMFFCVSVSWLSLLHSSSSWFLLSNTEWVSNKLIVM